MSAAQGLGDAAKKERDRRDRPASAAPRVYTQEDLKASSPPADGASSQQPGAAATIASTAKGSGDARPSASDADAEKRGREERAWRSRVAAARERTELARKKYERFASIDVLPYHDGPPVDLVSMTATAKAEFEVAQKALEDLLEEARRANVPPGWLR